MSGGGLLMSAPKNSPTSVSSQQLPFSSFLYRQCLLLPVSPWPHPFYISCPILPFFLLWFAISLLGRIILNFILPFYLLLIIPQSTALITSLSSLEPFPSSPAFHSLAPVSLSSSLILHSGNFCLLVVPRLHYSHTHVCVFLP